MANQMIALQARAPQTDILGGSIQRNAQMINMMRQQEAAERQAAAAAQQMQLAQAKEAREASAADIELAGKKIDYYTKLAGQTMNPQGYTVLLDKLDKDAPDIAAAFRANLPPEKFDRNLLLQMVGSIGDNFKATYGPLETEVVQADDGTFMVARTGGFGKPGVFEMEQFNLKPSGGAPAAATPRASAPAGMPESVDARATRGAFTTPQDLLKQGVNPRSIPSGTPFQPMSMTQGGAQPDLAGIVQNMMDTGVVSQADFDVMRAAAPGKDAQLAEILRSNNIKIMPSESSGGLRSAVYRPEEGAPEFQQAQSMEDYVGTGRAARGKSPMQSPLPGSAQVPIPRVRAEAEAGRPSEGELYRKGRAEEQAKNDVKFLEGVGAARESAQTALGVINSMIGDARLNKAGQIEIPRGGRTPHPGFEDVVGATWRPGARFFPGTDAADFDAYLEQVEGGAFLEAYERLKGTGQITEVEGQKATRAITRMKRSVSEPEFVKAAREFEGIIRSALARADERAAKLKGAAPRRTPVQKGGQKELRYNPATGDFE